MARPGGLTTTAGGPPSTGLPRRAALRPAFPRARVGRQAAPRPRALPRRHLSRDRSGPGRSDPDRSRAAWRAIVAVEIDRDLAAHLARHACLPTSMSSTGDFLVDRPGKRAAGERSRCGSSAIFPTTSRRRFSSPSRLKPTGERRFAMPPDASKGGRRPARGRPGSSGLRHPGAAPASSPMSSAF